MSDTEAFQQAPGGDRAAWIKDLRRANERQENALDLDQDPYWSEIEPTHRAFVERFLSMLPPGGSVLDAACGIGRYVPTVLASGRSVLCVDHTDGYLATVRARYPEVPTEKHDLQDLPYQTRFDGVMCVDAMEFVPPEDWPGVLARFRRALRPGGSLYLTVELVPDDEVRAANADARNAGLPVVEGEVIWHEPDDYYHYYPPMQQVRAWLTEDGFTMEEETEGPWHDEGYTYHHVIARLRSSGSE